MLTPTNCEIVRADLPYDSSSVGPYPTENPLKVYLVPKQKLSDRSTLSGIDGATPANGDMVILTDVSPIRLEQYVERTNSWRVLEINYIEPQFKGTGGGGGSVDEARLAALEASDTSQNTRITTAETNITAAQTAITAIQSVTTTQTSNITSLTTRVSTAETAISTATTAIAGKEPAIITGLTSQYWRGDKSFQDLGTAVRAIQLTDLSFSTSTAIVATDTVLSGMGKLQAQITAIASNALPSQSGNAGRYLVSNGTTASWELPGFEAIVPAGASTQYYRGDKSWQTLNTAAVSESTNLYFTDARVRAAVLTGFVTGTNTPIAATDTVLTAFGKLQAQVAAATGLPTQTNNAGKFLTTNGTVASWASVEPPLVAGTSAQYYRGDKSWQPLNTDAVIEATNLYFTESRVRSSVLTGLVTSSSAAIAPADTVVGALGKLQAQITLNAYPPHTGNAGKFLTTDGNVPSWAFAELPIAAGTTSQYWRGDKTWRSLDTLAVSENTNLYFTEARTRNTVLTGLSTGTNASVTATDSIIDAFGKVQAQLNNISVLPSQTNNAGKYLTTDGTSVSWVSLPSGTSSTTIGNGIATVINVTHTLDTTDVDVAVWELSGSKRKVDSGLEIRSISNTQVQLLFLVAPATNSLRVVVHHGGVSGSSTSLPVQTGNAGKVLTTNGSTTSWEFIQSTGALYTPTRKILVSVNPGAIGGARIALVNITTANANADGSDIRVWADNGSGMPAGSAKPIGVLLLNSTSPMQFQLSISDSFIANTNNDYVITFGDPTATFMLMTQADYFATSAMQSLPIMNNSSVSMDPSYAFIPPDADWGTAGTLISGSVAVDSGLITVTPPGSWQWDGVTGTGLTLSSNGHFGIRTTTATTVAFNGSTTTSMGPNGFSVYVTDQESHFVRLITLPDGWYIQYEAALWSNRGTQNPPGVWTGGAKVKYTVKYTNGGIWTCTWFDSTSLTSTPYYIDAWINNASIRTTGTPAATNTPPAVASPPTYRCIRVVPKLTGTPGTETAY